MAGHVRIAAGATHLKNLAELAAGAKYELDLALVETQDLQRAGQIDRRRCAKADVLVAEGTRGRRPRLADQGWLDPAQMS
jgi:hypothetical protein